MSYRLAALVVDLQINGSVTLDFMITGNANPATMTAKGRLAILQINQWLLAHDDAAKQFTTDLPDSAFASILDWLGKRTSQDESATSRPFCQSGQNATDELFDHSP